MQGQRCGERVEGSPPRRAPTSPFFFFFFLFGLFLVSSSADVTLTYVYLLPSTYHTAVAPALCNVPALSRFAVFKALRFLGRRRVKSENAIGFFCCCCFVFCCFCLMCFVSTLHKLKVKISGPVFKSRWCGYDIRLVKGGYDWEEPRVVVEHAALNPASSY